MSVDKNLFLYDLAVVAIMKNESHYVQEWLDYHILAGVDHFYVYDHESTDNFKEVLQPYIDAGIVDYIFYPGKAAQMGVYNEAAAKYRFFCRYLAFIDADEFILPKSNKSIIETVDEILAQYPNAGGLGIHWRLFGSNFLETADYSKGVLERFTRCHKDSDEIVKSITDPRKINLFVNPHFAIYFENYFTVNENGVAFQNSVNNPPVANKIIINHYHVKSKEEYLRKIQMGRVDIPNDKNFYTVENFHAKDHNDIFDDSILRYRADRRQAAGGGSIEINYSRVYSALLQNLSPVFSKYTPPEFFKGKMETFLTCRKLAEYLREKMLDEDIGKILEEKALKAVNESLRTNISFSDLRLLFSELPELLPLKYPAVQEIRKTCLLVIPELLKIFRLKNNWSEFKKLEFLLNMLKTFDSYEHK